MSRKQKRKVRKGVLILLCVLLLVILIPLGGWLYYQSQLQAVSSTSVDESFSIEMEDTYDEMVANLEEQGLIKSSLAARIYARLNGISDFYAGNYILNETMTTPEILEYIADSSNLVPGYTIVTIPEGYWAKDIAEKLSEAFPQYTQKSFLDLWNDEDYIKTLSKTYTWLKPSQIPEDGKVLLEGYLFPDTYFFDPDFTEEQITSMFLDQFDVVYQELKPQIDKSDMSLEEILTLASIVQFESGDPEDMAMIAGVFENRLAQGMKLESSVTVCYAMYEDFKSYEDCEKGYTLDDPYNTYLYGGLPPGPILNPGKEAIEAVLNPEKSDYLFFVADIHGDGSVYYAKTYEEHLANIEKYNLIIDSEAEK